MKHRRKVKDEQVTILQMAQQLKTKNINDVPGQQFCRQCKAKDRLRVSHSGNHPSFSSYDFFRRLPHQN